MIVWAVVPPGNDERSSSCGRVSVTGKKRRGKGAKNDCPPTQKKIKAGLWIKKQVPCDEGGEGRGGVFLVKKKKRKEKEGKKKRRGEKGRRGEREKRRSRAKERERERVVREREGE